jgi:hypothetical protein
LVGASVVDELAADVFKKKRGEKVDGQTATLNREGAHFQTTRRHVQEDKLQFLV